MEFRLLDLLDQLDEKMDLIFNYLDKEPSVKNIEKIEPKQDLLPNELEIKKDANIRRSGGVAGYGNRIIYFSPLSSQMIWYIAWLAFLIKEDKNDLIDIDDFIRRLIEIDKGENNDLSCKNLHEWDNKEVDAIFLYAMSFIFCHELGHHVFKHPGYWDEDFKMRDPELLKTNEKQADSFAANCVKQISANDQSELAVYGLIVSQIALYFIRDKEVNYITHPDPDTRLKNILEGIDMTQQMDRLISYTKDLESIYVKRRFV